MNVLIVIAHPDDAEIAMGMRIRWYTENGAHVRVHCLTTGSPAPNGSDVRREECLPQAPCSASRTTPSPRSPTPVSPTTAATSTPRLFRVFGCGRPDIVYTHYPTDQHLDHTATAHEVTAVALREAANLTYFRSPTASASTRT